MERGPWSSLSVFTPAAKLHPELEKNLYDEALADPRLKELMPDVVIYIEAHL